ncbi:MAG: hypothetical protein ACI9MR_002524, partial [Myxococcota bacterium]
FQPGDFGENTETYGFQQGVGLSFDRPGVYRSAVFPSDDAGSVLDWESLIVGYGAMADGDFEVVVLDAATDEVLATIAGDPAARDAELPLDSISPQEHPRLRLEARFAGERVTCTEPLGLAAQPLDWFIPGWQMRYGAIGPYAHHINEVGDVVGAMLDPAAPSPHKQRAFFRDGVTGAVTPYPDDSQDTSAYKVNNLGVAIVRSGPPRRANQMLRSTATTWRVGEAPVPIAPENLGVYPWDINDSGEVFVSFAKPGDPLDWHYQSFGIWLPPSVDNPDGLLVDLSTPERTFYSYLSGSNFLNEAGQMHYFSWTTANGAGGFRYNAVTGAVGSETTRLLGPGNTGSTSPSFITETGDVLGSDDGTGLPLVWRAPDYAIERLEVAGMAGGTAVHETDDQRLLVVAGTRVGGGDALWVRNNDVDGNFRSISDGFASFDHYGFNPDGLGVMEGATTAGEHRLYFWTAEDGRTPLHEVHGGAATISGTSTPTLDGRFVGHFTNDMGERDVFVFTPCAEQGFPLLHDWTVRYRTTGPPSFTYALRLDACGVADNSLAASTTTPEISIANNAATSRVNVIGATLEVALVLGQSAVAPDGQTTLAMTVTNTGELPSDETSVTLTLASGLRYDAGTATPAEDSALTWTIGTLVAGEQALVLVPVAVETAALPNAALTLGANATTASPVCSSAAASATAVLEVGAIANVAVGVRAPLQLASGDAGVLEIEVVNDGSAPADDVSVTVTGPFDDPAIDLGSAAPDVATDTDAHFELGTLAPGEVRTITIPLTPTGCVAGNRWPWAAQVMTSTPELRSTDNADAAGTRLIEGEAKVAATLVETAVADDGERLVTLRLTNPGSAAAQITNVLAMLPIGATLVEMRSAGWSGADPVWANLAAPFSLEPGARAELRLAVAGLTAPMTVTVDSPQACQAVATLAPGGVEQGDLSLTLAAGGSSCEATAAVRKWQATVLNRGDDDRTVTLTVTLPPSAETPRTLTWPLTIAAGEATTVTFGTATTGGFDRADVVTAVVGDADTAKLADAGTSIWTSCAAQLGVDVAFDEGCLLGDGGATAQITVTNRGEREAQPLLDVTTSGGLVVTRAPDALPTLAPGEAVTVAVPVEITQGPPGLVWLTAALSGDGATPAVADLAVMTVLACDDGNACTADACDATGCVAPPVNDGVVCNDGDACTQIDSCAEGACVGADPVICRASDACHDAGSCAPATGVCSDPVGDDGRDCDDGDACTQLDTCTAGGCGGADPVVCDDDNPCTDESCDSTDGSCMAFADDANDCSDGSACTVGDACISGACESGEPIVCDDDNSCTDDSCDSTDGTCVTVNNDANTCDDGDACTQVDTCADGTCGGASPLVCDDENPCTDDSCDSTDGSCVAVADDDNACSDGSACTVGDTCESGACMSGELTVCDDDNPCTDDSCDSADGSCVAVNDDENACSDGSACTVDDTCVGGACVSGEAIVCDDNEVCTADSCDPTDGACVFGPLTGPECDDDDLCTTVDRCEEGTCAGDSPVLCAGSHVCDAGGDCLPELGMCTVDYIDDTAVRAPQAVFVGAAAEGGHVSGLTESGAVVVTWAGAPSRVTLVTPTDVTIDVADALGESRSALAVHPAGAVFGVATMADSSRQVFVWRQGVGATALWTPANGLVVLVGPASDESVAGRTANGWALSSGGIVTNLNAAGLTIRALDDGGVGAGALAGEPAKIALSGATALPMPATAESGEAVAVRLVDGVPWYGGWVANPGGQPIAALWRGHAAPLLLTRDALAGAVVAIDDNGVVAGWARNLDGREHPFVWSPAWGRFDLPSLGGNTRPTVARGGVVAGTGIGGAGQRRAFVWRSDTGFADVGVSLVAERGLIVGSDGTTVVNAALPLGGSRALLVVPGVGSAAVEQVGDGVVLATAALGGRVAGTTIVAEAETVGRPWVSGWGGLSCGSCELDVDPPELDCPDEPAVLGCIAGVAVETLTAPLGSDACGAVVVSHDTTEPLPLGDHTVVWTATDSAGLTASCHVAAMVVDDTAPTIICPEGATLPADATCVATMLLTATAMDICTPESVTVLDDRPAAGFGLGDTTVTFTAMDEAGLTATCEAVVTVVDDTGPTIACPSTLLLEAPSDRCALEGMVETTVTDNCDGETQVGVSGSWPLGETPISFSARDRAGWEADCDTTVTVQDVTPPTIDCVDGDITATWEVPRLERATAEDACGVEIILDDVRCENRAGNQVDDCVVEIDGDGLRIDDGGSAVFITWQATATDPSGNSTVRSCSVGSEISADTDGLYASGSGGCSGGGDGSAPWWWLLACLVAMWAVMYARKEGDPERRA